MFDRDRITQPDRVSRGPEAGSLFFSSLQIGGSRVSRPTRQKAYRNHGFTMIELMLVVTGIIILSAIAIPSVTGLARSFRIAGDTRDIAAQLNVARIRAAANFTHARVYIDLTRNTFQLEVWNKAGGCWVADSDPTNTCLTYTSSAPSGTVINLSQGDTFGYGSIATGPTGVAPAEAPACTVGVAGPSPGATNSNTACIEYASRTYPVDSTNKIVASDAIYIKGAEGFSAIAVSISGVPAQYRYTGSGWVQF
jgi:Tfp pilus assembly protein FimT